MESTSGVGRREALGIGRRIPGKRRVRNARQEAGQGELAIGFVERKDYNGVPLRNWRQ